MADKKLFITTGRERDIIRYSVNTDQKDAREVTEEEAVAIFCSHSYTEEQARKFIKGVKDCSFNDWHNWR